MLWENDALKATLNWRQSTRLKPLCRKMAAGRLRMASSSPLLHRLDGDGFEIRRVNAAQSIVAARIVLHVRRVETESAMACHLMVEVSPENPLSTDH